MFPLLFTSLRRAVKDGEEQNKQTNKQTKTKVIFTKYSINDITGIGI